MQGTKLASLLATEIARFAIRPNKIYAVSANFDGKITTFDLIGEQSPLATPITPISTSLEDYVLDKCVDNALSHTKNGSMVMIITSQTLPDESETVFTFNSLGNGYIIYERKHLSVHSSLEEAVISVLDTLNFGLSSQFVLKFKRRQGKWFIHVGRFSPTMPPSLSKDERVYDLTNRIHSMTGGQVDND